MKNSIFILFTIFYSLGIVLNDILKTVCNYESENEDNKILFKRISFAIPIILSLVQLLLFFLCFKNDTPRQLCEENMNSECVEELRYIYKDRERSLQEYSLTQEIIASIRMEYPTYREIFTTKLCGRLLKGILIIVARNCCSFYIFSEEDKALVNELYPIYAISTIIVIIISFFTIDSTLY